MTSDFAKNLSYRFKNDALLAQALTHSSAAEKKKSYERLEFLGDRILGIVIADLLYHHFPEEKEGDLAKRLNALVRQDMLRKIADDIYLPRFISSVNGTTDSIIADVLEALIGAIYLDGGFEMAKEFVQKYWISHLKESAAPPEDEKSKLQEWAQARALPLPSYTLLERIGPDHKPSFVVEVILGQFPPQRGEGASKQIAEKKAAAALYHYLQDKND